MAVAETSTLDDAVSSLTDLHERMQRGEITPDNVHSVAYAPKGKSHSRRVRSVFDVLQAVEAEFPEQRAATRSEMTPTQYEEEAADYLLIQKALNTAHAVTMAFHDGRIQSSERPLNDVISDRSASHRRRERASEKRRDRSRDRTYELYAAAPQSTAGTIPPLYSHRVPKLWGGRPTARIPHMEQIRALQSRVYENTETFKRALNVWQERHGEELQNVTQYLDQSGKFHGVSTQTFDDLEEAYDSLEKAWKEGAWIHRVETRKLGKADSVPELAALLLSHEAAARKNYNTALNNLNAVIGDEDAEKEADREGVLRIQEKLLEAGGEYILTGEDLGRLRERATRQETDLQTLAKIVKSSTVVIRTQDGINYEAAALKKRAPLYAVLQAIPEIDDLFRDIWANVAIIDKSADGLSAQVYSAPDLPEGYRPRSVDVALRKSVGRLDAFPGVCGAYLKQAEESSVQKAMDALKTAYDREKGVIQEAVVPFLKEDYAVATVEEAKQEATKAQKLLTRAKGFGNFKSIGIPAKAPIPATQKNDLEGVVAVLESVETLIPSSDLHRNVARQLENVEDGISVQKAQLDSFDSYTEDTYIAAFTRLQEALTDIHKFPQTVASYIPPDPASLDSRISGIFQGDVALMPQMPENAQKDLDAAVAKVRTVLDTQITKYTDKGYRVNSREELEKEMYAIAVLRTVLRKADEFKTVKAKLSIDEAKVTALDEVIGVLDGVQKRLDSQKTPDQYEKLLRDANRYASQAAGELEGAFYIKDGLKLLVRAAEKLQPFRVTQQEGIPETIDVRVAGLLEAAATIPEIPRETQESYDKALGYAKRAFETFAQQPLAYARREETITQRYHTDGALESIGHSKLALFRTLDEGLQAEIGITEEVAQIQELEDVLLATNLIINFSSVHPHTERFDRFKSNVAGAERYSSGSLARNTDFAYYFDRADEEFTPLKGLLALENFDPDDPRISGIMPLGFEQSIADLKGVFSQMDQSVFDTYLGLRQKRDEYVANHRY